MRVMIADDELVARQGLRTLLAGEPDVEVVAEASLGHDVVRLLKSQPVDVLLLDINMPGLSGFDVIESVGAARMPFVIFVTAYDQHAVAAFDIDALDFLVKPFSEQRFRLAMSRAREACARAAVPKAAPVYPTRFKVEHGGLIRFVAVRDIRWVEAQDYCVLLHLGDENILRRGALKQFMHELDPRWFVRVHRSAAVNLRFVRELVVTVAGGANVRLHDGTEVAVAPRYRLDLEERLRHAP